MNDNQVFVSRDGRVNVPGSGQLHTEVPAGRVAVIFDMNGPKFYMRAPAHGNAERLEYLPGSPASVIVEDIRVFMKSRNKFAELGLGYKRGYLMHGPPGTGKSATCQMVIAEVIKEHNAIVLDNADDDHAQQQIDALRSLLGPNRLILVLLEEVEESIRNPRLLSTLDGTRCTNVVFLATTNYLDKLPPRIRKRPGRFDRIVDVSEYPDDSRRAYFGGRVDKGEVEAYVKAAKGLPISAWREILVRVGMGGVTPAVAGRELREWLKECADDPEDE